MRYIKSEKYDTPLIRGKIMGPNPLKLQEELLTGHKIPPGATVLDLGSGQGVTSVFLAKEYGFKVYATDLWSDPRENQAFFSEMGLTADRLVAVKADAAALPFEKDFFDAAISVDSYHYFGRNSDYLDNCLLPFVKRGAYLYIAIPGMKQDCHENLPQELLLSWNPEQLAYMRDAAYWTRIAEASKNAEIVSIREMESFDEVWNDWLAQDNEYAVNDRKAMNAGGGRYLNFIAIVLRYTRK